jgi:GTP-binding protein HflX
VERRLNRETSNLEELKRLAESAGYTIAAIVEQTRRPDPRYQIGEGKVEELAALVKEKGAERVIFDYPLKTIQTYNLAKATGVEAIDRFKLILEIFTSRATTVEAKLQIQLATQQYELAHAREKVRLTKRGEQPGFMGLGAYEADVYQEAVKREIHTIKKKLRKIREKRVLHRERRLELGFASVSLAGYTNAGKSSLFNSLANENLKTDKGLFTTLSTTTRFLDLPGKRVLLTDTVGFIDRLPLTLIEAFHSTLEEAIYADLIVLVLDFSEPLIIVEKKNATCLETLDRIGASGVPYITVLNKTDLLGESEAEKKLEKLKTTVKNPVLISALHQTNLDELRTKIAERFSSQIQAKFTVTLTGETPKFLSWVHTNANVKRENYMENTVELVFEGEPSFVEGVRHRVGKLNGHFELIPIHTDPEKT